MNHEEADMTIAALNAEVEELKRQIADLGQRAGRHDCTFDLCEFDAAYSRCLLRPCDTDASCWEE